MRFNRVKFKEKRAFEMGWQKKPYNYIQIQEYFPKENFGVLCGAEVRVLDDDTPKKGLITLFLQNFGETFRVRDHLYFKFDNGHDKKIVFNHPTLAFDDGKGGKTKHMGELQGEGTYVVGPGSTHPSGEVYEKKNDLDIITISYDKFMEVFGEFTRPAETLKTITNVDYNADEDKFIKDIKAKWNVGNRQDLTMSVAGYLRKEKRLGLKSTLEIIRRICMDTNDPDFKERMAAVRASYDKDEHDVKGYAGLKEQDIQPESEVYNIFTPEGQAKKFYQDQPYFYDHVNTFHLWNRQDKFWEACDEIDMLNRLKINIPHSDTINSKTKSEIITALKQVGRTKKPEDAPKTWVQFKNKIVDILSGEEFEPSPKYYTTNPIPWNISDDPSTPTIDRLIKEWVVDEQQDESYVRTMKEVIAYTICSDQFLQRIFAFCGAGMNGKGTFIKLLTKFIGTKNYCASDIKVLSTNNFESSALYKKLACIMGEVDASDLKNTNTIKKLSGEDDMRFEFKGKGSFTEGSITTCLIATNSMPTTPDKSMGFYRRWLIIDFPHQFAVQRDLIGQIPDTEFENLGRACLNLLKEMQESNKLTNEGDLKEREKRFEERSNPIMMFIEENFEEDTYGKIKVKEFYNMFNKYLKSKHLRIQSPKIIGKMLKEEGFDIGPRKIVEGGEVISAKCVVGIKPITTITTITTQISSQNTREGVTLEKGSNGSKSSNSLKNFAKNAKLFGENY